MLQGCVDGCYCIQLHLRVDRVRQYKGVYEPLSIECVSIRVASQ